MNKKRLLVVVLLILTLGSIFSAVEDMA